MAMTRQQRRYQERQEVKVRRREALNAQKPERARVQEYPGTIDYTHLPTVLVMVKNQMAAVALQQEWPQVEAGVITEDVCKSRVRAAMNQAAARATRKWRRFYGLHNKYVPHQGAQECARRRAC